MPFDAIENTNDHGQPIFLYEFGVGPTTWRYNSSAQDVLLNGATWYSVPISDDGVNQTGETSTDILTITAPVNIGPAQVFAGTPPSAPVRAVVRHHHADDAEAPIIFVGEITQVDFPTPGTSSIKVASLSASLEREGLRLGWQRTCPHALYDPLTCRVDKSKHMQECIVSASQNGLVTASGLANHPDGTFDGGFVEWEHPIRGTEFRAIESHVGDTIRMFGFSDGIYQGLRLRAYRGCRRTPDACQSFNNYLNYGGAPYMPGKSPFDGDPLL